MEIMIYVIVGVAGIIIGGLITGTILNKALERKRDSLLKEAMDKAEVMKKEKILQAKEKFFQLKSEHEKYINEKNNELGRSETRFKQKESALNQRIEELSKRQKEASTIKQNLMNQMEIVNKKQTDLDKTIALQVDKLQVIANLSAAEAKEQMIETLKEEARSDAMMNIKDIVDEARLTANTEAKKIIIETIQRTASEHAIENTVAVFNIENEEIKGRIIGREGRNIRALESLTGIEIIIDDSPDAIILSGFDPVRREIARQSLHKLVTDGRIHPARIEEVVAKTRKQIEQEIIENGKRVCIDLGIHNLHHELIRMIGRMKYRSSYGQNLLHHSIEVAKLSATMAAELGLNPKMAKRAGLLHDIGKVPDNEPELPHAILGMNLADKFKEKSEIASQT